jgi:hypothetical protein
MPEGGSHIGLGRLALLLPALALVASCEASYHGPERVLAGTVLPDLSVATDAPLQAFQDDTGLWSFELRFPLDATRFFDCPPGATSDLRIEVQTFDDRNPFDRDYVVGPGTGDYLGEASGAIRFLRHYGEGPNDRRHGVSQLELRGTMRIEELGDQRVAVTLDLSVDAGKTHTPTPLRGRLEGSAELMTP